MKSSILQFLLIYVAFGESTRKSLINCCFGAPETKNYDIGAVSDVIDGDVQCPNGRLLKSSDDPLLQNLVNSLSGNNRKNDQLSFKSYMPSSFRDWEHEISSTSDAETTTSGGENENEVSGVIRNPSIGFGPYADSIASGQFYACGQLKKSGSRFYYTKDQKFILKTVWRNQADLLSKILDRYLDYVRNQKQSFLAVYRGLFKVGSEYVVIMENSMYGLSKNNQNKDDHMEVYDLKIHCFSYEILRCNLPDPIDDEDKEKISSLGPAVSTSIIQQLHRDVEFLQSVQVNDYSYLIGIKGQHISIGVIDTLSPFHIVRKAGHYTGLGLSVQLPRFNSPERYAKLMQRMAERIFADQGG